MNKEVSPSEYVARFITQKSYYRPSNQTVRYNAFMPNRDGETSVYRITDINNTEINEIGHSFVADKLKQPLKGRAEIIVSNILEKKLKVEPDPNPHPRHANIIDWPEDRAKHRLIAIQLSEEAELHLENS